MLAETARHRICAAILAGGKARRMGRIPKGILKTSDGTCIVQRLIIELQQAGAEEIVIVANNPIPYRPFGTQIIPDMRRDIGPMGGIEAGLRYFAGRCDAVLFMPCDLPAITATEISRLVEASRTTDSPITFAMTRDFVKHPLCAIVHTDLSPNICAAIDSGVRSPGSLWSQLGARTICFDNANAFINLNSPGDLHNFRQIQSGQTCTERSEKDS